MDKILIIAEAGVNHNGSLELAYQMVDAAKDAGADIIKFQTCIPERIITSTAEKADYQKKATGNNESQLEMLRKLMLSFDDFVALEKYCRKKEIVFLSTPFDLESINFLTELGCNLWKIPSGEVTNYPYLVKIAQTKKPVIMSTGMCTMDEISDSLQVLRDNGSKDITLLQCTTEYPTPYSDVNLRAMESMKTHFSTKVGFSDHTPGFEIAIAASAMGATVIEKHFTLSRSMEGPDQKASLEPNELKIMINSIRNVEAALGTGVKNPLAEESSNARAARKSIVAKRFIHKGEYLTDDNITTKRPATGLSPMMWLQVIGTSAIRDFMEDELLEI